MIIDCASCVARPTECGDCVVSVILGSHPQGVELDDEVQTAVAVLAGSGLVPPLRLMPSAADDASSAGSAPHVQRPRSAPDVGDRPGPSRHRRVG
jgi:hypothetical protein